MTCGPCAGRLAAKEAMLTRLHATLAALHEQHTALTQVCMPHSSAYMLACSACLRATARVS